MARLVPASMLQVALLSIPLLLLAACGGGAGGESTASAEPPVPSMVDSFGRTVPTGDASDLAAAFRRDDSGVDGTAADGAPIAGAAVVISDGSGREVTATTGPDGYYRANVTHFVAPLIAQTSHDGRTLHSFNILPLKVNGFVTMNVTGLTDKVMSDVAVESSTGGGPATVTPRVLAGPASRSIANSIVAIRTQLAVVIMDAGLKPENFDPLTVPFKADHTGYDKVLDNLLIYASGTSIFLAVSPGFVPGASTGNRPRYWSMSTQITSFGGRRGTAGSSVVTASEVPSGPPPLERPAYAGTTRTVADRIVTTSEDGATVTTRFPDGRVDSVAYRSVVYRYAGCGACQIGGRVIVDQIVEGYDVSYFSFPLLVTEPVQFTTTTTYVRLN